MSGEHDHDDGPDPAHGPVGHVHPHDHGHHDHRHRHGRHHDRDHERSHGGGLAGALRETFSAHSHDAAESIDDALESDRRGIRAVVASFAALMITAAVQVALVVVTKSVALAADTIHNFSDALTAVPLFIAFRLGRRPANRRYTYGYRRAEDLAGLFVIAMITLSAVIAGWRAIDRLLNPRPLDHVGVLFAAGIIGFAGNELVALYRIREGRAIGSAALIADGFHARTDGFTSLGLVLGAVGMWAGFERADPIVGLAIAVAILAVLRGAAVQIYHRLMDAVDPAIVDDIDRVAREVRGVRAVSSTRVRWIGHRLSGDLTIEVDPRATVPDGHAIATATRQRLVALVRHLDDVQVHVHAHEAAQGAADRPSWA